VITTVTTTTTAILTTMTTASLSLAVVLILIGLLIKKELIGGLRGERARLLSRSLNIAIVPLLVIFGATITIRVLDILR
jgi:hypothetical protein